MKTMKMAAIAWVCAVATLAPSMKADLGDKRTEFTFSGAVEIPGQVLPAGTYVFKLLRSASTRSIVRVLDKDESRVIGTFLTIPDYRMETPEKPIVRFAERPEGSPPAIKSWFYPGDNYGNEFVYPKTRAVELARITHQNVPAMPSELASNTTDTAIDQNASEMRQMETAELRAEDPWGHEMEVAAVFLTVPALRAAVPADLNTIEQLPETAGSLPLFGYVGLASLAAGLMLGARHRKLNQKAD